LAKALFCGVLATARFTEIAAGDYAPRVGDEVMIAQLQTDIKRKYDHEELILQEVLTRYELTADPRLRDIMLCLIRHLHGFAREAKVTWSEWERGMAFLSKAADWNSEQRNEFVALSDVIGLTMQVVAASQPKPPGATLPTLIGPFFVPAAPTFENGADISNGASGEPLHVSGRVLDMQNRPVADAIIDVWQSDDRGLYDVQDEKGVWGRGRVKSQSDGRFAFWSVMPTAYPAPSDGAIGELIESTTRRIWRPAHLHFSISAGGLDSLVTHIFVRGSKYIDEDVAFGVRPALVADFVAHEPGRAPDGKSMDRSFRTLDYDFILTRKGA
jgi:hydroxyquinol 1,2-dioxygenase